MDGLVVGDDGRDEEPIGNEDVRRRLIHEDMKACVRPRHRCKYVTACINKM